MKAYTKSLSNYSRVFIAGIVIISISLFLISCKKKKTASSSVAPSPGKAVLVFPEKDKACTEGTILSTTESAILFNWNNAENTESYVLSLKNLSTGVITTYTATQSELSVTLLRGTPFSWFVTAKSSAVSATTASDTWKFYNAGVRTESYAPYPAEMISPTMNQALTPIANKVSLDWNASDADGDIVSYDVYMGTTSTPSVIKSNLSTSIATDVTVVSNTTYYWKVITKDSKGNATDSGLYKFITN